MTIKINLDKTPSENFLQLYKETKTTADVIDVQLENITVETGNKNTSATCHTKSTGQTVFNAGEKVYYNRANLFPDNLKNASAETYDLYLGMEDSVDNNLKKLKLLPDNKDILSRNLILDYYGYIPIVSIRNIPIDKHTNKFFKRFFDIIFSIIIIVGVLSWLTPILAIFIKLESKGPIFFKQMRNGLNYEEFSCYKFRSMRLNEIADLEQVSKNDPRITKIGKFMRKTSIDELPQFFNVLLGEMSVVGPRPHMVSHTEMYAKSVDKFMVRHFIKPGITGLAQTNGFRGEVENERDIINRVKYDIFYLENWSLLLDTKIIFLTIYNAISGEEKAY